MKSIQIISPGKVQIADLPLPIPEAGEVLLKINYIGFCGSDLNTYLGKNTLTKYPCVPEIGRAHV